jgi:hypothetical protein
MDKINSHQVYFQEAHQKTMSINVLCWELVDLLPLIRTPKLYVYEQCCSISSILKTKDDYI